MITLLQLTKYTDSDLLSARWLDDSYGIAYEFNAVHTADGRPLARTEDCPAPVLTAAQLADAQLNQHPAYELAAKGTAVRPDWLNRYTKAAQLVEAGHVRLTSEETAVVTSSQEYTVSGDKCHCKWMTFNTSPCAHYLAVRMARALNQPIEPTTEAEKEAACAANAQANRDAMAKRIAGRGENQYEARRRERRHSGEGARIYWRMAAANGRTTIQPDIARRAQPRAGGD